MKKTLRLIVTIIFTAIILCSCFIGCRYKKAQVYIDKIRLYAETFSLDCAFVLSVVHAESNFNANARSNKGACGLMQLMPSTAQFIAEKSAYKGQINLFDPDCNLFLGCAYLNYLKGKFNNEVTLLCAYNAGEGVVFKWLNDRQNSLNGEVLYNIPYRETERYVKKVQYLKKFYANYLKRQATYEKGKELQLT